MLDWFDWTLTTIRAKTKFSSLSSSSVCQSVCLSVFLSVCLSMVVVDRFHIALFSAVEQTRCVHVAWYSERLKKIWKKSKRHHVTPLLKELHWLPVKYRIQYKLATLAFRHFDGTPPPYLSSSLHISTIAIPSFFDRKTAQNSKNTPENLRWTFFWLHCSDCLELAAGRPESFSLPPSFQS